MPEIGINDVLIKVLRTGICGTDLHIHKWDAWAQSTIPVPMVVGHEFMGEIAALGNGVQGLEVGQRIAGVLQHRFGRIAAGAEPASDCNQQRQLGGADAAHRHGRCIASPGGFVKVGREGQAESTGCTANRGACQSPDSCA